MIAGLQLKDLTDLSVCAAHSTMEKEYGEGFCADPHEDYVAELRSARYQGTMVVIRELIEEKT